LGPKDDLSVAATDLAARMFLYEYNKLIYFDGISAFNSGFGILFLEYDEWSSVLIEG
jgi:hypothetical protein